MTQPQFPAGGPREPVYALMRQHGFTMSNWSDKHWISRDGLAAHIYGTGSMVRIVRGATCLYDGPLDDSTLGALE